MYAWAKLKIKNITKSLLEADASASAYDTKQKELVNKVKCTTCSSLSREEMTLMSKFIKSTARFRASYSLNWTDVMVGPKRSAREAPNGKVDFVLAGLFYKNKTMELMIMPSMICVCQEIWLNIVKAV